MSDDFKGDVKPIDEDELSDDMSEGKKRRQSLRKRANQMLSLPLDELEAEAERERLLEEEKQKRKLQNALAKV